MKIKMGAHRSNTNFDRFMQNLDLAQGIVEEVTITIEVDRKEVTQEYLRALEKHVESMDIGSCRYSNVHTIMVIQ